MNTYKLTIKGQQSHITALNQILHNQTEEQVMSWIENYGDKDYCADFKLDGNNYELNNDYYIMAEIESK